MDWIFETKDRNGTAVRMSKVTYEKHLPIHPEIAHYIEEAKITIQDPELILRDEDKCYHHYRLGLGRGKFKNCYVHVLVRYRGKFGRKVGVVASYWLSPDIDRIGKGKIIWIKRDH